MTEIRTQAERDALEAAARAICERRFQNFDRMGDLFIPDAEVAIAAYLASLAARGMRVMPRTLTSELIEIGWHAFSYEKVGDPIFTNGERLQKAHAAMHDSFADLNSAAPQSSIEQNLKTQSDGGKG